MKKLTAIIALLLTSGCMNLYTRFPTTDATIEGVYQSTGQASCLSLVVAFPQMMSDNPGDYGLWAMNIITIPVGCLCVCDAVCEAAIDTVCLPFDWPISVRRAAKRERDLTDWDDN